MCYKTISDRKQILKGFVSSCDFCHSRDPPSAASTGISSEVFMFLHHLLNELFCLQIPPPLSQNKPLQE